MNVKDVLKGLNTQEFSDWTPNDYRAYCHHLGYDPNKLEFEDELSPDTRKKLMIRYDDNTAVCAMITNPQNGVITVYPKNIFKGNEKGSLAHEIFHIAFYATMNAANTDKVVSTALNSLPSPLDLIKEYKSVSWYADQYIRICVPGNTKSEKLTITEVLSEMASRYEVTGELVNTPNWKKLYRLVEQTAIEKGVLRR